MRTWLRRVRVAAWAALWTLSPGRLWAQGTNPWEEAVNALQAPFTGALSLVAMVIGGLMLVFGEGGRKRGLFAIIFGIGMATGAVNFLMRLL